EIELSDIEDLTTRTMILQTVVLPGVTVARPGTAESERRKPNAPIGTTDPELQAILRLRSRDRAQVVSVLRAEEGLTPALVPHVIPLLAWDPVAADAVFALRKVAEERVGEFVDVLID